MVARGEVQLDTPLQDLLPKDVQLKQVPDHPIRLVDVASQSSGLPRMPSNFAPKDPTNPYADYTPKLMFDFLRGLKLTRPPGEYEYSNLGMGLLGYLLAERAGKPYEQLLIERIADPLQMNDTRITLNKEQLARFAPPYNGECTPDHNWDIPTLAGAGGIRSTANDLLKLVAASLEDNSDGDNPTNAPHRMPLQRTSSPPSTKPGKSSTANKARSASASAGTSPATTSPAGTMARPAATRRRHSIRKAC